MMHTHSSLQSPRFRHLGHPRAHAAPGASAAGTTTRRSLVVPHACYPARRQQQAAVHHQVHQSLQILTSLLQRGLAARKTGHLPLARATTRRRRMHRERERSRGTRVAGAACCRNLEKADAVLLDYFLKSRVPSARSAPSAAGSSCSSKQRRRAARRHGSARPPKGPHEQFDLLGRKITWCGTPHTSRARGLWPATPFRLNSKNVECAQTYHPPVLMSTQDRSRAKGAVD